jgi:hypothetical protein
LLLALIGPWRAPRAIFESYPSSTQVLTWELLVATTVGTLLSLPVVTLLVLELRARGPSLAAIRPVLFLFSSYAAIGLALWLAAFAAFPAFVARQRAALTFVPAPWAYVELELQAILALALAAQLSAILLQRVRAHFAGR